MILTQGQVLNSALGLAGWIIIEDGQQYIGTFFALRLVQTTDVTVNGVDISILNESWNIGQYFFGNITSISNNSGYAILAYITGITEPVKVV